MALITCQVFKMAARDLQFLVRQTQSPKMPETRGPELNASEKALGWQSSLVAYDEKTKKPQQHMGNYK